MWPFPACHVCTHPISLPPLRSVPSAPRGLITTPTLVFAYFCPHTRVLTTQRLYAVYSHAHGSQRVNRRTWLASPGLVRRASLHSKNSFHASEAPFFPASFAFHAVEWREAKKKAVRQVLLVRQASTREATHDVTQPFAIRIRTAGRAHPCALAARLRLH